MTTTTSERNDSVVTTDAANQGETLEAEELAARRKRVGWGRIFLYLIGTLVLILLLLVAVDKFVMPWYVKLGQVESVPSVLGIPYAEAQKRLEKLGFEVKKSEPRFDNRYPAGTVVMQLPYGGAQTKMGRRVYLTLSRGTEMIPVPELLGMPVREARIMLMRAGFDIGEMIYQHNDTIMKGLVFAQGIPAKVGARPGSIIDVMISRGPSTRFTMMPNLLSLDIDQARSRLENAGLVLGVVRYKENPAYVHNTVIEQTVAPYAQVAQGAAVDITICGVDDSGVGLGGDEEEPDAPPASNVVP